MIRNEQPNLATAESQSKAISPTSSENIVKAASQERSKDPPKDVLQDAPKEIANDAPGQVTEADSKGSQRAPKPDMAIWQMLLVLIGVIVFIFAFAVLISHCLAWFLVYKTESRLGEVRTGLLRGGEMKLCLCGRG